MNINQKIAATATGRTRCDRASAIGVKITAYVLKFSFVGGIDEKTISSVTRMIKPRGNRLNRGAQS
ncbi:MAG: hypothetical protein EBE86_018895 [Hormoscilla sp. GUM202]|nr:hypothetical protein [Hormoscilla sp. GM7CHS1pb]MBO1349320.1 hypothetical protein [Hormoscilla sp. GUM202]